MASEIFSCPQCNAKLRYSPNMQAGDEVQCPKCKAEFPVPELEEERTIRSSEEVTGAPGPRRPRFSEPGDENISSTRRSRPSNLEGDDYEDEDFSDRPFTGNYSIDINRWFNVAGKHYSAILGPMIGFLFVAWIISFAANMLIAGVGVVPVLALAPNNQGARFIISQAVTQPLTLLMAAALYFPLWYGTTAVALKQLKGRPWTFGDFFLGFRQWGPLACLGLISQLLGIVLTIPMNVAMYQMQINHEFQMPIVGLAVILIGLPVMIFIQIRLLLFAPAVIFDRKVGAIQAMKANWELTKGHFWSLFGIGMLIGLILMGGALACGIGLLFAFPYTVLIMNAGYLLITDPRGPEETPVQHDY